MQQIVGSETKNCDECMFGIHRHYDKDGMPTVRACHGYAGDTVERAIERYESTEPCEKFAEGHKLYLERKAIPRIRYLTEGIPASQHYIYDPLGYSKEPVGRCTSFHKETCTDGDGVYCYRIFGKDGGCTACHDLQNENRMSEPMRSEMIASLRAAGVSEKAIEAFDRLN